MSSTPPPQLSRPLRKTSGLWLQPWFVLLLAAYAVLELSFNHRLLELAGGAVAGAGLTDLQDMERWARVVSGLGLALLLIRALSGLVRSRLLLVLLCTVSGLGLMWHLQKALVDAIVESASEQDMQMSVQSLLTTQEALKGRIELRGQPVFDGPAPAELRPVVRALWPSTVLGLTPDDLELTSGAAQMARQLASATPSQAQMRAAYRRVVMTPVALGASLLFGLLNLCQLFAAVSVWTLRALPRHRWRRPVERGLLPVWLVLCLGMTWLPGNSWVNSAAYTQVARPGLWQEQPFLAPFVEWSLRAEPAWSDPVAWVHHRLLADFDFRDPSRLAPVLGQ